jgi:rubredoxin
LNNSVNNTTILFSGTINQKENTMEQYVCQVCGHVHDEATEGAWATLSDNFICPECGCYKDEYVLQ